MHIMWIKAGHNSGIKSFFSFYHAVFLCLIFFFLSLPSHFSDPQLRSFHTLQMHILKEITAHICQKQNCMDITRGGGGGGRLRVLPVGNTLQVARTISGDYWWHVKVGQSGDLQGRPGCKHAPAARPPLIFSTRRRGVQMHLCHLCQVFPGAPCDSPRRGSGCGDRWEHLWPLIRRAQWHAHLSNGKKRQLKIASIYLFFCSFRVKNTKQLSASCSIFHVALWESFLSSTFNWLRRWATVWGLAVESRGSFFILLMCHFSRSRLGWDVRQRRKEGMRRRSQSCQSCQMRNFLWFHSIRFKANKITQLHDWRVFFFLDVSLFGTDRWAEVG